MRLVQLANYSPASGGYKTWARTRPMVLATLTGVFAALGAYAFIRLNHWELIYLLMPAAVVALAYPLSFRPAFSGFTSLRKVAGLKLFLIALSWSYVTVLVPAEVHGIFSGEILIEGVMRSFLVIALIIPFDIRDMKQDDPGMRTIPQVLGEDGARELALFFLLIYQVWVVLRFFLFSYPLSEALGILTGVEIAYFLILRVREGKSEWFYSFWIEGVPVFAAVLVLLFQWLFEAAP